VKRINWPRLAISLLIAGGLVIFVVGFASGGKSRPDGLTDLEDLKAHLNDEVAAVMVTNPNTVGKFDSHIVEMADLVHKAGAFLYLDGANMNAILGITRPGDFGADMMHYNVHKTFTGPHGAGGPGSGPIAVRSRLAAYLRSWTCHDCRRNCQI